MLVHFADALAVRAVSEVRVLVASVRLQRMLQTIRVVPVQLWWCPHPGAAAGQLSASSYVALSRVESWAPASPSSRPPASRSGQSGEVRGEGGAARKRPGV